MIELHASELAARLRRGTSLKGGDGAKALEEIIQPSVILSYLGTPPWRSEPRSFATWGDHDGGIATEYNTVILQLTPSTTAGPTGIAVVHQVKGITREAMGASGGVMALYAGWSAADVGTAAGAVVNCEELSFGAGNVGFLPFLNQRELDDTLANIVALGCVRIDELILGAAAPATSHYFNLPRNGIVLPPGGFLAVLVADSGGGVVPPDMAASFTGEYYLRREL